MGSFCMNQQILKEGGLRMAVGKEELLKDMTKDNGLLSHNSPVQDEMTVNMAIRGANKVRVAKHENHTKGRKEKENDSDQDTTIVVSAAMVIPNSAVLKSVQQNSQAYESNTSYTDVN